MPTAPRWPIAGSTRRLPRVAPEAKAVPLPRLHGQRHVVEGRVVLQKLRDLERACEAALDAPGGAETGDLLAFEQDAPVVLAQLARDLADHRGLARPVRADQGMKLARDDVEREIVGGDQAAEPLDQPFQAKHGHRHRPPRFNSEATKP
jgi:hypothetical protein